MKNTKVKNVFITGGAGYIGSHCVVSLVKNGFKPIIIDNFLNSHKNVIQKLHNDFNDFAEILSNDDQIIAAWAAKVNDQHLNPKIAFFQSKISNFLGDLKMQFPDGYGGFSFASFSTVPQKRTEKPPSENPPSGIWGIFLGQNYQFLVQKTDNLKIRK